MVSNINFPRQHRVIAEDMQRHLATIRSMASDDARVLRAAALIEQAARLLTDFASDAPGRVERFPRDDRGTFFGRRS